MTRCSLKLCLRRAARIRRRSEPRDRCWASGSGTACTAGPIINASRLSDWLGTEPEMIADLLIHPWRTATALATLLVLAALAPQAHATSRGGPAFTSGGDFPGEYSCVRCHYYRVDTGPGEHELEIDGVPAAEFAYVPGQTVSMILRFSDPDAKVAGFLLTARTGDGCDSGGTFEPGPPPAGDLVKVRDGASPFSRPEPCGDRLKEVEWATHSLVKEGSSVEWGMAWTPPGEYRGPVTIAYAINGANGDGSAGFDTIYFGRLVVQGSTQTLDPPTITDGGLSLEGLADGSAALRWARSRYWKGCTSRQWTVVARRSTRRAASPRTLTASA